MDKGLKIVETALSFVGTPYRHQGFCNTGMDCIGLIYAISIKLGMYLKPGAYAYEEVPDVAVLNEGLNKEFDRVAMNKIQPGDVLLMKFASDPQHLAVYGGEFIVHSYSRAGGVVKHRFSDIWRKRTIRAYRFKDE